MNPPIQLMLDSGAFTAHTQSKIINLNEYCEFILKNQQHIERSVCLDVIGPNNPEVAAAAGMANFKTMLDKGIMSMPVLHARERVAWLDEMLKYTNVTGLSGTSLVSPREDKEWHRLIWAYCTDSNGFPIANFHSFGNTSIPVLMTYPFFSADSASWLISGSRAARIKIQGKSFQVRSSKIKDTNYILAGDTGPKKQSSDEAIRALGLNPDILLSIEASPSQLAMLRSYCVAADLLQLKQRTISCTKYKTPASLLSIKKQLTGGTERLHPVNLYFVLSPSAYAFNFPVLAALNIKHVLVSFYYLVTSTPGFWDEKLLPFLYDPVGFCQSDPKVKVFWEKLHDVLLQPAMV